MRYETEAVKVYYANDGTRFLNEQDCVDYENACSARKARLQHIHYFMVASAPDLKDGEGWYNRLFIAVEGSCRWDKGHLYANAACYALFGSPIAFLQNGTPIANWRIIEVDDQSWERWRAHPVEFNYIRNPATRLFISDMEPLFGFPPPLGTQNLTADRETIWRSIEVAELT